MGNSDSIQKTLPEILSEEGEQFLSREERILVNEKLLRLRIEANETMSRLMKFSASLISIERMQKILRDLKGDLINEHNQQRLDI